MSAAIVTVSQLCRYVKSLLEEQKPLADLLVKGEVSDLSYRSLSGHLYFTLRDGDSAMRCVMFSRYAEKLQDFPDDGSTIIARGTINLYERDGSFQLIVYDIQRLGAGVRQRLLEETKQRLQKEKMFSQERKRPLPQFPRAVGVITSKDGAALQDIIATFRQLNPLVRLIIYPATVQGSGAAASVVSALETMINEGQCDSCVIARGGGSSDDLSAFDDETLVRAAVNCPIPVVSAVGHEVDYSLLDLAADARAATPTAACRLMAAPISRLTDGIFQSRRSMDRAMSQRLERLRQETRSLSLQLAAKSPVGEVKKNRQKLEYLVKSLEVNEKLVVERLYRKASSLLDRLELVNPANLLRRGYSITSNDRGVVTCAGDLAAGDSMVTQLAKGIVVSTVTEIKEDCHNG